MVSRSSTVNGRPSRRTPRSAPAGTAMTLMVPPACRATVRRNSDGRRGRVLWTGWPRRGRVARMSTGELVAVSDLHVSYAENRQIVQELRPRSADDWLLVAGDVGEQLADVESTLATLRERFANVVWAPG